VRGLRRGGSWRVPRRRYRVTGAALIIGCGLGAWAFSGGALASSLAGSREGTNASAPPAVAREGATAAGGCLQGPMCTAAPSDSATNTHAAQTLVTAAATGVAACFAKANSAVACASANVAGVADDRFGQGPGEVFVAGNTRGYVVSTVTGAGEAFLIVRDGAGQLLRACTPVGVESCSREGTW
jgi:hypothetical protein